MKTVTLPKYLTPTQAEKMLEVLLSKDTVDSDDWVE